MNGISRITGNDEERPDLLPHKYRPASTDRLRCHSEHGQRLKRWIQDFISLSNGPQGGQSRSDDDYSSDGSEFSDTVQVLKNCALITGPPGVGKTSLVYTVANELNLHVVESHSSEKRDAKLFSMLKLTNQKGKINAFAKLFMGAANLQKKANKSSSRRKRRKLVESTEANQPRQMSLTGDTSIVLFDDIDVIFEEDGPFLKSLVEFIKESKRPVVLTATQSIDYIKTALINCEHINLERPTVEDCALLLKDICRREKHNKISKIANCQTIANYFDCDIRQCLNRIHFYGDQADDNLSSPNCDSILPNFTLLNSQNIESNEKRASILNSYMNSSLVDLIESKLNIVDRSTSLKRWLDGIPSFRIEGDSFEHSLGEQIKESIVNLTKKLYSSELMSDSEKDTNRKEAQSRRDVIVDMGHIMNDRIKSRIEPPERDFYTDIVPFLGETIKAEGEKREKFQPNSGTSRRSKRFTSYLESVAIYFESHEFRLITQTMLDPMSLVDTE